MDQNERDDWKIREDFGAPESRSIGHVHNFLFDGNSIGSNYGNDYTSIEYIG